MTIENNRLLAVLFLVLATTPSFPQQVPPEQKSAPIVATSMPMPSVAPLFIEDGVIHSEITIVNALLEVVSGNLTLRDVHGDLLLTKDLTFSPHEKKVITLRSLLNAAITPTSLGSMTLEQDSRITGVALLAQLSMSSYASATPAHLEEEFSMPEVNGSKLLRGVVSESLQPPSVAITSLSDATQTITLSCLNQGSPVPTTHSLSPRATLLLHPCNTTGSTPMEDLLPDPSQLVTAEPHSYGIEIASTAPSEDFVAFGLTRDKDRMEAVEFADPASLHSTGTVYAGVPAGPSSLLPQADYLPRISVANFTSSPQTVSVLYASTQDPGSSAASVSLQPLKQIIIPPLSTQTISLNGLPSRADLTNSFIFRASGPVGAVQVRLYAEGGPLLRRVELLGKDEKSARNGGNHPWSTAKGDTSTLLLFNYTGEPQTTEVQISASASTWNQVIKLQPYQTKKISINQLIATETPDLTHHHLLRSETSGELQWFTNERNKVTGRLLISDPTRSLARSFSCYNTFGMCQTSFFDPNTYAALVAGDDVTLSSVSANECVSSNGQSPCDSTQTAGLNESFSTTWSLSSNPPVSINSSGQTSISLHGTSMGPFTVQAQLNAAGCISTPPPGGGYSGRRITLQTVSCDNTAKTGSIVASWGDNADLQHCILGDTVPHPPTSFPLGGLCVAGSGTAQVYRYTNTNGTVSTVSVDSTRVTNGSCTNFVDNSPGYVITTMQ